MGIREKGSRGNHQAVQQQHARGRSSYTSGGKQICKGKRIGTLEPLASVEQHQHTRAKEERDGGSSLSIKLSAPFCAREKTKDIELIRCHTSTPRFTNPLLL